MNQRLTPLIEALETVCSGISKYPQDLRISTLGDGPEVIVFIEAHAADYPKLVGSKGRVVKALKKIIEVFCMENGVQTCDIDLQAKTGEEEIPEPFQHDPKFDFKQMEEMTTDLCHITIGRDFSLSFPTRGDLTLVELRPNGPISKSIFDALYSVFWVYGMHKGQKLKLSCNNVEAGI